MKGLTKAFGIYIIRNTSNGKVYVGSTVKSFSQRWGSHRSLLRRGKHVDRIRGMIKEKVSYSEIARAFGVSKQTIYCINSGKTGW